MKTKEEFRQTLNTLMKQSKEDLAKYVELCEQAKLLDRNLERLHTPLDTIEYHRMFIACKAEQARIKSRFPVMQKALIAQIEFEKSVVGELLCLYNETNLASDVEDVEKLMYHTEVIEKLVKKVQSDSFNCLNDNSKVSNPVASQHVTALQNS